MTTRTVAGARSLSSLATTSSLNFNAATATPRVAVANNAALNNLTALTVEAWVLVPALPNAGTRVADSVGATAGLRLFVNSGSTALQATVFNGSTNVTATGIIYPLGRWFHAAMTWDGANIVVWTNGTGGTAAALSGGNTGDAGIGLTLGNRSVADRNWQGLIQEVRFSKTARYTVNFTPPSTPFASDANTIGLWHLDDGSGTSAIDSGPNGLTGTLQGTTLPLWSLGGLMKAGSTVRGAAGTRTAAGTRSGT